MADMHITYSIHGSRNEYSIKCKCKIQGKRAHLEAWRLKPSPPEGTETAWSAH